LAGFAPAASRLNCAVPSNDFLCLCMLVSKSLLPRKK
jgi:hypothetical protein